MLLKMRTWTDCIRNEDAACGLWERVYQDPAIPRQISILRLGCVVWFCDSSCCEGVVVVAVNPFVSTRGCVGGGIGDDRQSALAFVQHWHQLLRKDSTYWDQNAFNDLLKAGMATHRPAGDGLFHGYNGKLLVGILPVGSFCSGHTFFVQRMPAR